MYCPKCGRKHPDGASFCTFCGAKLSGSAGNPVSDSVQNSVSDAPTLTDITIEAPDLSDLSDKIINNTGYSEPKIKSQNISSGYSGANSASAAPKESDDIMPKIKEWSVVEFENRSAYSNYNRTVQESRKTAAESHSSASQAARENAQPNRSAGRNSQTGYQTERSTSKASRGTYQNGYRSNPASSKQNKRRQPQEEPEEYSGITKVLFVLIIIVAIAIAALMVYNLSPAVREFITQLLPQ